MCPIPETTPRLTPTQKKMIDYLRATGAGVKGRWVMNFLHRHSFRTINSLLHRGLLESKLGRRNADGAAVRYYRIVRGTGI